MYTSTTVTRRMRRSEHEWRAVMDRFDRSGLGAEAFCARGALRWSQRQARTQRPRAVFNVNA